MSFLIKFLVDLQYWAKNKIRVKTIISFVSERNKGINFEVTLQSYSDIVVSILNGSRDKKFDMYK